MKFSLEVISENFSEFIDAIKDLTKVGVDVKVTFTSGLIYLYSTKMNGNIHVGFKSKYLQFNRIFSNELTNDIEFIIPNAKKFVGKVALLKIDENSKFNLDLKELGNGYIARSFELKSQRMRLVTTCGEEYSMAKIPYPMIQQLSSDETLQWSFNIESELFESVKKMAKLHSDPLIRMNSKDGKIAWTQIGAWELDVCNIDPSINRNLILNTAFLTSVDTKPESIEFRIHDNYMMVKSEDSTLMLAFEQDFE